MKRLLFEIHRWLGILIALFMVLWFFSGLVIVYAGSLNQTRLQQRAHGEILAPAMGWLSVGEAWERSAPQRREAARTPRESRGESKGEASVAQARMVRHAGVPLWLVDDSRGRRHALSAIDGSLHQADADEALAIAAAWVGADKAASLRFVETADSFATLRNTDALRPIHRIALEDGSSSELLISAHTGEVLQASTRVDRGLYWAGNWLHVFRPLDLMGWGDIRHDVLAWVSGIALIATLTGLIVGWLRWRPGWFGKRPYAEGRSQPYRAFWFRWHFWSGLIGGTAALLWVFSGFLNNNPWQIFSQANAGRDEAARYQGAEKSPAMLNWRPSPLGADIVADTVELSWHRLGAESVLLAHNRAGQRQALDAGRPQFSEVAVASAVKRLAGEAPVAGQVVQNEYDSYYYPRHNRGIGDRPLPIIRAELADAAGTRLYIDPQDGRLLLKQDSSRRTFRWLFSALHHWDFGWFYSRPLWDVWMVSWCLFGLVLSISATVVGWRRLVRSLPLRKSSARATEAQVQLATETQNQ
ncbi:MAG: PepSY domain-containing protein [Rhodocyclales bacterium]|nr:PepSY domain-containing protein [Rhodocyclales bacterium]